MVMLLVEVATAGLMLIAFANVAAAVFAIVPSAWRYRPRDIGFGLSFSAHPGGIEQIGLVPATPVYAAIVVYVFLVTGAASAYRTSVWVPLKKLIGQLLMIRPPDPPAICSVRICSHGYGTNAAPGPAAAAVRVIAAAAHSELRSNVPL